MTDTSKDAVYRLVIAMIRSGNITGVNMLTALAVDRDAANARADQARDAALVEAAGSLEAQALDAEAQAKRFRGGSDPWADRTARSRALRNSATAILALRDKPAPAVTMERVQHIKRGTTYQILARGMLQTDTPLTDYAELVAYRCEASGDVWFRPQSEFTPDRFRAIAGGGDE